MPLILALGMLRQEDGEFEACLGYIPNPVSKNQKMTKKE
jgi:hypothetical protein